MLSLSPMPGASAKAVQQRLNQSTPSFGPYEAWTAKEFARRSQRYWMVDTGAGAGVLFMAVIVCLVGSVVTSQSLKAVVAASSREYAVLNALGVSRAALGRVVVEQACWIGGLGFVWVAVWIALYQKPDEQKRLSAAELAYIRSDQTVQPFTPAPAGAVEKKVSWFKLLTYRQVLFQNDKTNPTKELQFTKL